MIDSILAFTHALNDLSPAAMIVLVVYLLVKGREFKQGQDAIRTNHLHELPEMVASLSRIEQTLQSINDNIIFVKARVEK